MKKILISLALLCLIFSNVQAQKIIQNGDTNIDSFPQISFTVNYYKNKKVDTNDIKLKDKGIEIEYKLKITEHAASDTKTVLILFEDMLHSSHDGQKKFYTDLLTGTLNNFVNPGDKINIAFFDRTRDGNNLLQFVSDNYTDDVNTLIKNMNDFENKPDNFNMQQGSDLFQAIYDGLEDLKDNHANENNILLVLSAGYNNQYSNNYDQSTLKDLSMEYKIPIYMVQYFIWEHRSLETFIESTYGKFLFTKDLQQAQDSLTKFMNNSVKDLLGYDYNFVFETSEKPKNKLHSVNVEIENNVLTINYLAKCNSFGCWLKYNLILVLGLIIALGIIIALVILYIKKNKAKISAVQKDSEEQINLLKQKSVEESSQFEIKLEESQQRIDNIIEKQEKEKQNAINEAERKKIEAETIALMKRIGSFPKIITEIEGKTYSFEINRPTITFGRKDADYVINNQYISRLHFKITFENNSYFLYNLSQTNPTVLNGKPISGRTQLKDRDLIITGPIGFHFFK